MPKVELDIQAQIAQLSKGLKQTQTEMKKLQTQSKQTSQQIESNFKKATTQVTKFAGAFGLAFSGAMAVREISKIINVIKEFETSLATLSSITGAVGKDLEFLRGKAIELSNESTLMAKDVLEAFKLVGSAKPELLKSGEALAQVTKEVIKLSEASGLDLNSATIALTNTMNQFSASAEEAARFINVMAAGSKYGAVAIPAIAEAIRGFGTVAAQANISIEESVGLIETLGEKGLVSAEAGIKLRNILIKLQAGVDETNPAVVGLVTAIENLGKKNLTVTELTKEFGLQNVVAAQILIENVPKIKEYTTAVTDTSVAYEQAAINTDTLAASFNNLRKAYQNLILGADTDKLVEDTKNATNALADLITKFGEFSSSDFMKNLREFMISATIPILGVINAEKNLLDINKELRKEFEGTGEELQTMFIPFINQADEEFTDFVTSIMDGTFYTKAWQKAQELAQAALEDEIITVAEIDEEIKKLNNEKKKTNKEDRLAIAIINDKIKALEDEKRAINELTMVQKAPEIPAEELPSLLPPVEFTEDELDLHNQLVAEALQYEEEINIDAQLRIDAVRKKYDELDKQRKIQNFQQIAGAASQFFGALSSMYQAQMNKELQQTNLTEKQKASIMKKYHEKEQKAAIIQAIINGAVGVTQAFAQGGIIGFITGALIAAAVAIQIETIKSQKFAKGTYQVLKGRRHYQGGIPVYGGEAEDGEGMAIFSRSATQKYSKTLPNLIKAINEKKFPVLDLEHTDKLGKKADLMLHRVSLDDSKDLKAIRKILEKQHSTTRIEGNYRIVERPGLIQKFRLK